MSNQTDNTQNNATHNSTYNRFIKYLSHVWLCAKIVAEFLYYFAYCLSSLGHILIFYKSLIDTIFIIGSQLVKKVMPVMVNFPALTVAVCRLAYHITGYVAPHINNHKQLTSIEQELRNKEFYSDVLAATVLAGLCALLYAGYATSSIEISFLYLMFFILNHYSKIYMSWDQAKKMQHPNRNWLGYLHNLNLASLVFYGLSTCCKMLDIYLNDQVLFAIKLAPYLSMFLHCNTIVCTMSSLSLFFACLSALLAAIYVISAIYNYLKTQVPEDCKHLLVYYSRISIHSIEDYLASFAIAMSLTILLISLRSQALNYLGPIATIAASPICTAIVIPSIIFLAAPLILYTCVQLGRKNPDIINNRSYPISR